MEDILQRYFDMENSGIGVYFDADEIIELLDYFEDIEDFEHYKKVVKIGQKLHPKDEEIQIGICKACFFDNDFEKALTLIEQLSNNENTELKLLKCECFCALDRYKDLTIYLETMKTDSDEELGEIYECTALALREQYDSKNAYDFVVRGLALFPNSVRLKEELCYHLDYNGHTEKAIGVCKELIDYDPYCTDYWYILGRFYSITGAYDRAIDAFDFALVCDESDLEVKILRAFCYFMKEDFEKVVETYEDVFFAEHRYAKHPVYSADSSENAYVLLKKMTEKYDITEADNLPRNILDNMDNEMNGLINIADCFPESLLFLLFKEMELMAAGEQGAMNNVEQIIHNIYLNGTEHKNCRIDTKSANCLQAKQKLEKLAILHAPDIEYDNENIALQIIKHLLDGNIDMFCQLYAQTTFEAVSDYLVKIFPAARKCKKQNSFYLRSDEICRSENNGIALSELTGRLMANKNLHN